MKKLLVVVIVVAIALVGANAAMAAILNSKHDLSATSDETIKMTAGGPLSACQFCHTPHLGSNAALVGAPLWNRSVSGAASFMAGDGTTAYQVYGAAGTGVDGITLSGTTINLPGPTSKTCLSCHDGILSLGNVLVGNDATTFSDYGTPVLTGGNRLTGGVAALGTDLTNEHPVGFVVNPAAVGPGLDSLANMQTDGARFYTGNRMECGTCHDPHETGNVNKPKFLRMNIGSLCTDCHVSK